MSRIDDREVFPMENAPASGLISREANRDAEIRQNGADTPELQEDMNKLQNLSFSGDSDADHNEPVDIENTHTKPPPICSMKILLIVAPVVIAPFFLGYANGIFGAYLQLYVYATNCELYKAPISCATLSGSHCKWNASAASNKERCIWEDKTTCNLAYFTLDDCSKDQYCAWDYGNNKCGNQVGYSSSKSGLLGAAMIIGAMVGALSSGHMTKVMGYRLTFAITGIAAVIACALMHISTAYFIYWLFWVGRLILGIGVGLNMYTALAYTNYYAPPEYRETFGTIFQVTMSFGAFMGSVFGIALGNTIPYSENRNAYLKSRMQAMFILLTINACCVLLMPLFTKDIPKDVPSQTDDTEANSSNNSGKDKKPEEIPIEDRFTAFQVICRVLVCFCMAISLQFTGISAVTNYAPKIMGSYNLDPLVGNIILMAWNGAIVFGVLPLSRIVHLRTLFLVGNVITATCCLFLCGIPVFPNIAKTANAKNGAAIAGIFIYIGAYQLCVGPTFFVLAIDMFPKPFQPYGVSFMTFFMFLFNLLTTLLFPIAVENLSGGPSGNQDKGQAITFMFFGVIGYIMLFVEYFFMYPWMKQFKHLRAQQQQQQQ